MPARLLPPRRTAVQAATLVLFACGGAWAQQGPSLPAAPAPTQAVVHDIPAGPLSPALSLFAGRAGVTLSADPALTEGLRTPGLQGRHAVLEGFAQLLQGTGLVIGKAGDKTYVLRRRPTDAADAADAAGRGAGAASLAEVRVTAAASREDSTEGTGSYAARSSTVGSKTGQSLREVPQSVSVVTRQQIEDMALTSLPDVLRAMPGVTTFQGTMLADRTLSRGFEFGNGTLRVDGGATLSPGFSLDNDLAMYDHVEVLRGADGLFGGNGEPGGVTNLVRKKPTRERQLSLQGQYGSFNFRRAEIDASGPLSEDGRIRGRAVLAQENKDFFFDVARSRRSLAYGVLEMDLGRDTTALLGGSYVQRDSSYQGYGLPRARTGEALALPRSIYLSGADDHADKSIKAVFAHLTHRFNADWQLQLDANHDRAAQERFDHYFSGAVDASTGEGLSGGPNLQNERWRNSSIDASLKGRFGLWGRQHDLVLGADWYNFSNTSRLARTVLDLSRDVADIYRFNPWDYRRPDESMPDWMRQRVHTQQSGLYGSLRLQVAEPLHLIAGGRLSRYRYRFTSSRFDTSGNPLSSSETAFHDNSVFTPYLAATYRWSPAWTAYASMAETFKSQASYTAGPAPGTPLEPVTGRNYELGLKGEHLGGQLHSAFALYRIERDGAAVRDRAYPSSAGPQGSSCCYLPTGRIVSKGFDAEVSGQPLRGLQLSASYSYNDNRDKNAATPGRYNGVNPAHLLKFFAAYQLPAAQGRWKLGGGVTVQGKTYVDDYAYVRNADGTVGSDTTNYRISQGGYAIASASVEYRIDDRWTAALNINNLCDRRYYSTVGYLDYGNFFGAPRNAMVTLRGRF